MYKIESSILVALYLVVIYISYFQKKLNKLHQYIDVFCLNLFSLWARITNPLSGLIE
jgi:hypothetical protein